MTPLLVYEHGVCCTQHVTGHAPLTVKEDLQVSAFVQGAHAACTNKGMDAT